LNGLVRSVYTQSDGLEVTNWIVGNQELACLPVSLFTGRPTDEYLETIEDTKLLEIPYAIVEVGSKRFTYLSELVRLMLQDYIVLYEEQNRLFRLPNCSDKLNRFSHSNPGLYRKCPASVVASYLGISKTSMNRLRIA
jgi:hypothetical protein